MRARVWYALIALDKALDVLVFLIPMPQRTRLGSGRFSYLNISVSGGMPITTQEPQSGSELTGVNLGPMSAHG